MSEKATHSMRIVAKIQSIQSSWPDFDILVTEMKEKYDYIFKQERFPSSSVIKFSTTIGHAVPPQDKNEMMLWVNSIMEIPAITAANVIYKEKLGLEDAISQGKAKLNAIEFRVYYTYFDKAGEPSEYTNIFKGIEELKPDGFFYLEGRSNPIMVCEYYERETITVADYKKFERNLERLKKNRTTLPSSCYTKFMDLFERVHSNMIKYGSECGFVTSGCCWIFCLTDPKKPGELKYHTVFIENKWSWKKAFEVLLAMLLKPLTNYSGKKDWSEWTKQDRPIDNIKKRLELFKEGTIQKNQKNTEEENGDDDDEKGGRDDKNNTTNQNNFPSKRTSTDAKFESDRESKRRCTGSYFKQYKILPLSEPNFNVLQQYPKNENKNKTTAKKDEKVTLQLPDQNTTTSTSVVKQANKPKDPLARYCTQKCLLGLKKNLPMDEKCPNYNIHKQYSCDKKLHPINCNELVSLFTKQLESYKVKMVFYNSKEGAVGKMGKFTLYPYGYTLVSKHRFLAYEYNAGPLKYEAAIYEEIEGLQGKWIPVCLGYVETDDEVCILLSYGGETPETEDDYNHGTVRKIVNLLREYGVDHNDVRPENIVLNKELGHEMLIDFHVAN